jgi:hypothetical protein
MGQLKAREFRDFPSSTDVECGVRETNEKETSLDPSLNNSDESRASPLTKHMSVM